MGKSRQCEGAVTQDPDRVVGAGTRLRGAGVLVKSSEKSQKKWGRGADGSGQSGWGWLTLHRRIISRRPEIAPPI